MLKLFGTTGPWLKQMIGVFGWLDTNAPVVTYIVWFAGLGLVSLITLACAKGRELVAFVLLLAAVLVVPVVISYAQVHRLGDVWQGRYTLPLAVGVPLMAAALVERSGVLAQLKPRLATVLCVAVGIADVAAFAGALRRNTVGVTGPSDYLHGAWQPPLGATVLSLAIVVVTVLFLTFVRCLVSRPLLDVSTAIGDDEAAVDDHLLEDDRSGPAPPPEPMAGLAGRT